MNSLTRRCLMALALVALPVAFGGCDEAQHVVLIEVFSTEDVASIEVELLSLDETPRRQPHRQTPERFSPARTPEALRGPNPIRLSIEPGGPVTMMVHIRATTPAGDILVATRCYDLNLTPIIQDEVLLFPVRDVDADGDSFVSDPGSVCREPTDDGGLRNCDADDYVCPDDFAADCNDDPATVAGSELTGADIQPGARTYCQNGIDEDCDGSDEPCADDDGDGFNACPPIATPGCDCNDAAAAINPRGVEMCGDGIDQDCDGFDAPCDNDEDGFVACVDEEDTDCDCADDDPTVYPGATETPLDECDGKDNNCNGLTDEVAACLDPNLDRDPAEACDPGVLGTPAQADCDCNDCDPGIYGGPEGRERCHNGIDDDCDLTVDEGCPDRAADMDGDGQAPPLDCDDTDPFAYTHPPGVPIHDLCGNGVAASCVPGEDRPCAEDLDDDGYVESAGCENDPARGPLVAETCNGVDDDCDGVIDEVHDMAMPPMTGCIDGSPVAFFSDRFQHCGACRSVCSNVRADRCVAGGCDCSSDPSEGECAVDADTTEPKCCGEGCVDISDDPDNCGECGRRCGAQEVCLDGVCTCGAIAGPDASAMGNAQACPDPSGTEPLLRENEVRQCCNDACSDVTMDDANCGQCGLACGQHSSCRDRFCECEPPGAEVWSDCNSDLATLANDGCEVDINSNASNCGGCTVSCGTVGDPETCVGGACTCGPDSRAVGDGRVCRGSTPRCEDTVGCVECTADAQCASPRPFCVANACVACRSAADCDDTNECTSDACSAAGVCSNSNRTGTCMSGAGMCVSGGCCTGCNDSGTCRAGTSAARCGLGGAPCMSCSAPADMCASGACVECTANVHCSDSIECTNDVCTAGVCSNPNRTGSCMSGAGTCVGITCCPGCNDGGACRAGNTAALCGVGGVSCMSCSGSADMCASGACVECTTNAHCNDGNPCTTDTCSSGSCSNTNRTGSCTTSGGMPGMCDASATCCPGCITGGACQPGTTASTCGAAGEACDTCGGAIPLCVGGNCVECATAGDCDDSDPCTTDTCSGGTCSNAVTAGASCMGGAGTCDDAGDCCTGCFDGAGTCVNGDTVSACGAGGGTCAECVSDANASCDAGVCRCGGSTGDVCTSDIGDSCGGGGNRDCRCGGGSDSHCTGGMTCTAGTCS